MSWHPSMGGPPPAACPYCGHSLDGHAFPEDAAEERHACYACPHGLCPSRLDLGYEHYARWLSWSPDRELNPQYEGIEDVDQYGVIVEHLNPHTGRRCHGAVIFDSPTARRIEPEGRALWTVVSLDPLTVEPSVLCRFPGENGECGDHGYIRDGRWVPA